MVTQAEQARHALEDMIIFNELSPGVMYSESQLAGMLGFGRTPIREALQRLAQNRMIAIFPRQGVKVTTITAADQLNLLEVRRAMEPQCVLYGSLRADFPMREALYALAESFVAAAEASDEAQLLGCLRQSHELLTTASQNPFFASALGTLQGPSRRYWFYRKEIKDNLEGANLHADILFNAAKGNGESAMKAVHNLLDYLTEFALAKRIHEA